MLANLHLVPVKSILFNFLVLSLVARSSMHQVDDIGACRSPTGCLVLDLEMMEEVVEHAYTWPGSWWCR